MTSPAGEVSAPAQFSRRRVDGCTVISAIGELDAASTYELKRQLDLAIADGLFLIVDVSRARLVDDSARALLDGMDNLLHAFGGRLSVISMG